MVTEFGEYTINELKALRRENLVWIPTFEVTRCEEVNYESTEGSYRVEEETLYTAKEVTVSVEETDAETGATKTVTKKEVQQVASGTTIKNVYEIQVVARRCPIAADWQYFPFDSQNGEITVSFAYEYDVELSLVEGVLLGPSLADLLYIVYTNKFTLHRFLFV